MVDKKLVSVNNLNVSFIDRLNKRDRVVKGISFNVLEGRTLAIIGESGSGKTITGLSITKLLPLEKTVISGSIKFNGQELMNLNDDEMCSIRGKEIGMIFQEPMTSLNPLHTIGNQIGEIIKIHSPQLPVKSIKARVINLLKQVGLNEFTNRLDHFPHQLSGGQRQRIMIAIAIANNPKLLIADEPTTALDLMNSKIVLDLIKQIKQELNLTMIFITHDLDIVRDIADDICIMKEGEIVETGIAAEILANPQHEYTKFLLNSEPKRLIKAKLFKGEPLLKVHNLRVNYPSKIGLNLFKNTDKKILDDVNIELMPGETLGIVGKSGSGKTTLAMALLKLIKASGSITLNGKQLDLMCKKELRNFRKYFQIVFQDPFASLNPRFKIFDIIAEGPRAQNIFDNEKALKLEIENTLNEVGLDKKYINRYPHELSGGQRQRVAIARALIMNPNFIILDEPTSALDKPTQQRILQLLYSLQRQKGLSYLLISHDYKVINALCHSVSIIEDGRLSEKQNTKQAINNIYSL